MRLRTAIAVLTLSACADDAGDANPTATSATDSTGAGSEESGPTATSAQQGDSSETSTADDDGAASSTGPGPSTDGGSTGSESGAESSTGASLPDGQWAITEITYSGPGASQTVNLEDCTFCDATLNGPTLLVRYQQAEGFTVWTVDIPIDSAVGSQPITDDFSGAYVAINEANPDLSSDFTGFYQRTSGSGTLTLTQADIESGGVVAGTLVVHLTLGNVSADLDAEFYAEIP